MASERRNPEHIRSVVKRVMATLIPTEHQEQSLLFQWAAVAEARAPDLKLLFAIPNFSGRLGKATVIHSARLNREGRKKGVPDLMLPVARGGYHGLFIEMKRLKKGALSAEQIAWLAALNERGYKAVVCRGWEEARDVILAYLTNKLQSAA